MKDLKIGIITQARVGSSRLPGKTLLKIGEETLLEIHLKRLLQSGLDVYLATTTEVDAVKLIEIAYKMGVKSKIGSLDDVLSRYYLCAKEFDLDVVIRVTSDCPFICEDLIRDGLKQFLSYPDFENIYLSNTMNRNFPRGLDFEIFSFKALEWAYLTCLEMKYREHVTPFLYLDGKCDFIKRVEYQSTQEDYSQWRLCVDEQLDLDLINMLIKTFNTKNGDYKTLKSALNANPNLIFVNNSIEQKKV